MKVLLSNFRLNAVTNQGFIHKLKSKTRSVQHNKQHQTKVYLLSFEVSQVC